MSVSMNETITRIKRAGASHVRSVPMPSQHVHDGSYQIEVEESGVWSVLATDLPKTAAESIISRATNRVICG